MGPKRGGTVAGSDAARGSSAVAAVGPVAFRVLGAAGVLRESTAVFVALMIGLVSLAAAGVLYARVERLSPLWTAVSVAVNLGLGLVIVALEVALSH